jgi:hypothetical protein
VASREQLPPEQLPEALKLEVPRGPVEVAERVQALASATAATENAPTIVEMRKNCFMVLISLFGEGCHCGSHAKENGLVLSGLFGWHETNVFVLSTRCNSM